MEDELRARVAALEAQLIAAHGEALFAGHLVHLLLGCLVTAGAIDQARMAEIADVAALGLEKLRGAVSAVEQRAFDYALRRLLPLQGSR